MGVDQGQEMVLEEYQADMEASEDWCAARNLPAMAPTQEQS